MDLTGLQIPVTEIELAEFMHHPDMMQGGRDILRRLAHERLVIKSENKSLQAKINEFNSRTCEQGTKGCDVFHSESSDFTTLLPCPECKRTEKDLERKSCGLGTCCIACKCGFHGPISDLGEMADFLWNDLAR